MTRRQAALAAAGWLAACTPPQSIVAGPVDPERVAAGTEAAPAACGLVRRAGVPITVAALPLVTARINGQPATLVLDTGAESAILTAAAARRLGVPARYDFVRSMSGIGRAVPTGDARLASMSLGGLALAFPRALVGDIALNFGGRDVDGLLGASLLGDYDLDIDVPRRRLSLYDRQDCAEARPDWAGGYSTVDTTRSLSQHPFFPITVNGHRLSATLDTGAQRSVVSSRAAAAAGIGPASLVGAGGQLARGATGEVLPASLHAVELEVAGFRLGSPVLVTAAGLPRDIDALLGLDFLLRHRVWLSYGARRMFIARD